MFACAHAVYDAGNTTACSLFAGSKLPNTNTCVYDRQSNTKFYFTCTERCMGNTACLNCCKCCCNGDTPKLPFHAVGACVV
ncbi:hypothetical protein I4U23_005255 [Adineta vaga]|nr:hypothetical protein I4U23_005255 [Adineta vaga]